MQLQTVREDIVQLRLSEETDPDSPPDR